MSARTLVLPTVLGLALMACGGGGGGEMTAPRLPPGPRVPPDPVVSPSVDVTPAAATLARGARLSLFLTLKGFSDDVSDRGAIWSSSDSRIVQVSRLNVNREWSTSIPWAVAYAASPGNATITVWVAGRSASVPITVTEATADNYR